MPYVSAITGWQLEFGENTTPTLGDDVPILKVNAASWNPLTRDMTLTFVPGSSMSTLVFHDVPKEDWTQIKFQGGF